jgi:DNA-binding transcriptional regulator YiaG
LNEVLAKAIAKKPHRLTPGEIRFLRKYLGWSGKDFAQFMGVTPETVSRWENGAGRIGETAERFLRDQRQFYSGIVLHHHEMQPNRTGR